MRLDTPLLDTMSRVVGELGLRVLGGIRSKGGVLPKSSPWRLAVLAVAFLTVALLDACLVGLVVIQARWAIAFLRWPLEVMYGEALIQDHAARLLRGQALYQALGQPSFTVATYTPVFYVLMAVGQAFTGPGLFLGRVVSLFASLATAALLGHVAARQGRGTPAAVLAALLFLAFGFPTPFPWLAIAKEDTLGVAFGISSIAVLVGAKTRGWRIVVAAVLAALAILTKQTLIASALAGLIALLFYDRRAAARFGFVSLGLVGVVVAGLELTTHAFLANAVFANAQPFRLDVLLTNLATLKAYQAGPLAVAAFAAARRLSSRASFEDTLLPIYWLATLLQLVGLASVGSAQNYWIEVAAATAVLASTEIWYWITRGETRGRLVGLGLSLAPWVNVVVAGRLALIWLPGLAYYADPVQAVAESAPVVEAARSTPGDVLAEPLDVLMFAGKPALVEPWAADVLFESGTWDVQPLVERVCAGDIHLAILAHPLENDVVAYNDYAIWPAPLLRALRSTMVLQELRAERYIYVLRPHVSCAAAI